jgi:alpha-L-arabinofuranosidase
VQQAFSTNRGDVVLPLRVGGAPLAPNGRPRLFASATRDDAAHEIIVKVVNALSSPVTATIAVEGARRLRPAVTAITLHGAPDAENSLDAPRRLAPLRTVVRGVRPGFAYTFKPRSLTVLRLGSAG